MAKKNKYYENPLLAKNYKGSLRSNVQSLVRNKVKDYNGIKDIEDIDINKATTKVADMYIEQLLNVTDDLSNSTLIVGAPKSSGKFRNTDTVSSKVHSQFYDKLSNNNFYIDIENAFGTDKTQTGSKLYTNLIRFNAEKNPIVTNRSNNKSNVMNWSNTYNNINKLAEIKESGGHLITFDTETLSGLNGFGHNSLEHITEISATIHEIADGKMTIARRIDSVLGFDESQYKAALERLEKIQRDGVRSLEKGSSDAVFFDRMNIYSTAKTVQDEFEFHITEAAGIDDINTSIENARKGIENLYEIGKKQQTWIRNNVSPTTTLDKYSRQFVANINDLISTGTYKGQTYNNYVVLGQNSSIFDIPKMQIFGGNTIDTTNHLDLYQANLMIQDVLGPNAMYAKGVKSSSKYGRATQENLSSSHGYKVSGKAAHIAQTDQEELARMMIQPMKAKMDLIADEFEKGVYNVTDKSYFELLKANADKVNDQLKSTSSIYTGKNQLFYMDYTQQKSWSDQEGALSFAYDPTSKKFKSFDGFNIKDSISGSRDTGYNQYGARSGTLATHEVIQVNTTEQFKQLFKDIPGITEEQSKEFFQNVANANELYLIKTQEYIDRDMLIKKMGSEEAADFFMKNQRTVYTIETNRDRLGANFGIHVGDLKDGQITNIQEKAIESIGLQEVVKDENGKISTTILDSNKAINSLKEKTINRSVNDAAARKIRDLDYNNLRKLINFREKYKNDAENPITYHATKYAEAVATGKPVDLKIQAELGWKDFNTGNQVIAPETVRNSVAMEAYVKEMTPVFNKIEKILDDKYGTIGANYSKNSEAYIKREMGFKQLLNDYMYKADKVVKGNVHSARDLNKIDFKTSEIFFDDFLSTIGTSSNMNIDDITSIDLNNANSLLNTFFKNKFEDVEERVVKNSAAGWTALTDAYKAFKKDDRFKGMWGDLNVDNLRREGYSVVQANDIMMDKIKKFVNKKREKDSGFGLLHERKIHDVIDIERLKQISSINEAETDKILQEAAGNLREDVMLVSSGKKITNRNELQSAKKRQIDYLVDNYFMGYSKDDFDDSLKGYTSEQQRVLKFQDRVNRRTANEYATDLIDAIQGEGNLAYMVTKTKNGAPILSLVHDGNVTQLNAQRFTLNKGLSTSTIGNNEYVNRIALSMSTKKGAMLSSTSEKARATKSMTNRIKWAKTRGDSVADAIIGTVKDRSKMVAEATTRIDFSNGQLFAQAFTIDTNDMIKMLPKYAKNGKLKEIYDRFGIADETLQVVMDLAKKVENSPSQYGNKAFKDVLPRELNHLMQFYKPLLQEIKKDVTIPGAERDSAYFREIFDYIEQKTKTTALRTGIDSIDKTYYMDPFAEVDDTKRPPMTQMANAVLYDNAEVDERLKNLGDIKVKKSPIATNSLAERFLYNNTTKAGSTSSAGLSMKFLQIDSYTLQDKFLADKAKEDSNMSRFLKDKSNFDKDAAEVLFGRATSLSTYEQQGLINARVSDAKFHKINTQKISASKQMLLNMDSDLETITYVKNANKLTFEITNDGEVVYNNGYHVRAGQTLGRFGNEDFSSIKTAKYDGIFRGRFFNEHGNVVDADILNKLIAKEGLKGADAKDWLMNNFQYKYEVLPVREMHGMKVFVGPSEKTTTDSLKMAVGSLDTTLVDELKELGLGHLGGSVTYTDYLYGDVRKTLKDAGRMDLWDRVLDERYALSDYMQEFDEFKGVGMFSAVNADKHNSVSLPMQSFMNTLQEDDLITEENMTTIFGKGNYKILDDGRVEILPSMSKIRTKFEPGSALDNAMKKTMEGLNKDGFKDGYGFVNVVQGYDDIAGTYAGSAQDLSRELNELDRQISAAKKANDKAMNISNKTKSLIAEKEELTELINNLNAKAKQSRDELLDKIKEEINYSQSGLEFTLKHTDDMYAKKKEIYEKLKASDKKMEIDDPYKVKLRNEMAELDEMIAENKEIIPDFLAELKELKKQKREAYKQFSVDTSEKRKRLDDINSQLKKLSGVEIEEFSQEYINDLINKKTALENTANAMDEFKGVKFSEAMGANLDRTVFNKDLVKKLQDTLDPETFQRYFGYAMDGNVIKSEYLGKSMADPITGKLRNQLYSKENSLLLKDIESDVRLKEQYGYLVDAIKNSGGEIGDVSVSTAESMYSYNQGLKAMRYNEALSQDESSYKYRKALIDNKLGSFKEIDIADLELDIEGQGRQIVNSPNNPYTNDLIIKTGLGENYDELAIARMPEVHAGDSLVKKEHIKQLSVLKDKIAQYHGAEDITEKEEYKKHAIDQVEYIKALQKTDVTSKTGVVKDLTEYRMNESFFGKASGVNINAYKGDTDLFGILKADADSMMKMYDADLTREEVLNTLAEKNSKLANKTFNGKGLLEHYAEGRLIDSVFVSEKTFENLGYFDKDRMNEVFSNLNDDYKNKLSGFDLSSTEGQKSAMKHLLSTEGDSFITVRYPEIMAGSDKFAQVYLDNTLKDNQIMVMGATGMSAKLDHDGDQFAVARVTSETGKSKLTASMTSADAQTSLMTQALDSSMMVRAATDNVYWESQVKDQIMKERGFATSISEMKQVAGKRYINGEIYTSKITDPNMTLEKMHDLKDKYTDVLKEDLKDYRKMSDEDLVSKVMAVNEKKGIKISKEDALNEYMAAWSYADTEDMITAKIYQNAVGETNVTAQRVKKVVTDLMDKTTENYEYKQQILSDFLYRAEEGAISSKSSVEGLEPDRAKKWNDAVTGVLKGQDVDTNKATMKEWLEENVQKQAFIESYYARSSYFADKMNSQYGLESFQDFKAFMKDDANASSIKNIMSEVTNDVINTISEFSGNQDMIHQLDTLKIGVSQTGVKSELALNPLFVEGAESNLKKAYQINKQLFGENGISFEDIVSGPTSASYTNQVFRESIEEIMSSTQQATSKVSTESVVGDIIEGVGDFAKSASGKKLAMGAVGIAAGIMVAGYVGGRPRPADVHAMEEAQDYQTPMEGYQLADPGMAMSSGQQGYVININARTKQGRQNTINALQQAIANGSSSNINIAMNITDDYGNINDRQIEEAIMGAF